MSLTSRLLPPEEWPRLEGTGLDTVAARLPATASVIVVEDDGRIVGCVAALLMLHAEGLWIAPEYRKRTPVWRRLVRSFWSVAENFCCTGAWAAAMSDDMRRVLAKMHAAPLPGDHYIIRRKGR